VSEKGPLWQRVDERGPGGGGSYIPTEQRVKTVQTETQPDSILALVDSALKKELAKEEPDKDLLNCYSSIYTSIAKVHTVRRISFGFSRSELAVMMIWFVGFLGATVAAKFAAVVWAIWIDVAALVMYWTALLLALLGVSALSDLKK